MALARVRGAGNRIVDPVLAFAVLGGGIYDIWFLNAAGDFPGSRPAHTAFLLLTSLPLAWLRRSPLLVLAIIAVGTEAWIYTIRDPASQPPFEPAIALLLASFTVAAHTDGHRMMAGAAIMTAVILADVPALMAGRRPGDTMPAWVLYALAFALGRVVHRQRSLAAALAERAAQLEREREEKARLAVALERARIARELHDVVTHNVSVMVLQASVEGRLLGHDRESIREALRSIEQTGRDTLVELRRLLGVLRKGDELAALAPQPRLERLDELLEQTRDAGLPVQLRIEGESEAQLPAGVELSAYRIIQEALTNSLKHAGPARAEVIIRYRPAELELDISDNGRGPSDRPDRGHGLVGMRERVALHGGVLAAGRRDGGGFRVHARLPLETGGDG